MLNNAGDHPHQNLTASVRSESHFPLAADTDSKRASSKPGTATHHRSSCWWGFLSYAQSCSPRWECPTEVERGRWHATESWKTPTSQLPYDFVCVLIFVCEDIAQLRACVLLLAMKLNEADVLSHTVRSACASYPSQAFTGVPA